VFCLLCLSLSSLLFFLLLLETVDWLLLQHMLSFLDKHTHDLLRRMSVSSTADMAPLVTFSGTGAD